MDDRGVTDLYIEEMRALLPALQRHIGILTSGTPAAQRLIAMSEIVKLSSAAADLSAGFHADDCAQLAHELAQQFIDRAGAGDWLPTAEHLAAATDALTYLSTRVRQMVQQRRVLAPTEAERAACARLCMLLRDVAEKTSISGLEIRHQAATQDLTPDMTGDVSGSLAAMTYGHDERKADTAALVAHPAEHLREDATGPADMGGTDTLGEVAGGAAVRGSEHQVAGHGAEGATGYGTQVLTAEEAALIAAFEHVPLRHRVVPISPASASTTPPAVLADSAALSPALGYARRLSMAELDEIPPEMKRLFVRETAEDLQELRMWLLEYEAHPELREALAELGRIAHKIKGSAATLGFAALAAVTLAFEDALKALRRHAVAPSTPATSTLVHLAEVLRLGLEAADNGHLDDAGLVERAHAFRDILLDSLETQAQAQGEPGYSAGSAALSRLAEAVQTQTPSTGSMQTYVPPVALGEEQDTAPRLPKIVDNAQALRVDVHRLDGLVRHVSALSLTRATLAQTRTHVNRLRTELDQAATRLTALSRQISELSPLNMGDQGLAAGHGAALGGGPLAATSNAQPHGTALSLASRLFGHPNHDALSSISSRDVLRLEHFSETDSALRALAEAVEDINTTSRALGIALGQMDRICDEQVVVARRIQHDVMQIRLVPLETLVPRLQLEVRRLAPQQDRQVQLVVRGEHTEIDRKISEALEEPLLQLVRNAIMHGIEEPEVRTAAGKPEMGTIWVHAYYTGNEVTIEMGDDGAGVNPHALAAVAVAMKMLSAEEARALSAIEALDLMFAPGVTTASEADVYRGRGIGLDEVRTRIERLKGSIQVRSVVGRGSVFRIRVPISLSVVHTLKVRAGGQDYAVPFSSVVRTLSLAPTELLARAERGQPGEEERVSLRIRVERADGQPGSTPEAFEEIPALPLAELLGFEQTPSDPQLALVVDVGGHRAALLVDAIHDDSEAVVQALPAHLRRRAVRGATVTAGGQLILLLDLVELVAGAFEGVRPLRSGRLRPLTIHAPAVVPHVLVVDDSISIRRSLEISLSRAGFIVQVAQDGIEALDKMLMGVPRVLVLDIEMPRLDGVELLSILRGSPQLAGVRVVILTSRAGEQHRARARALGAEAYFVKPCPQDILVETVRTLIEEPATVS